MKAHLGVDSRTKLIHAVVATPANVADGRVLPELLHDEETGVWGDQAYRGQRAAIGLKAPRAQDFTNRRYRHRGDDRPGRNLQSFWPPDAAAPRRTAAGPDHALPSATRKVQLKSGQIFWRAQLGNVWLEREQDGETYELPYAYPAERMKPLSDQASEGRANAKGIPCLYLANRKETAMSEVRTWVGSYVSSRSIQIVERNRDD